MRVSFDVESYWLEKAQAGDANAQFHVGLDAYMMRNDQKMGSRDYYRRLAQAVHWWTKAAEQDHTEAQFRLGTILTKSDAIRANKLEGAEWLRKAAAKGHAEAQQYLDDGHNYLPARKRLPPATDRKKIDWSNPGDWGSIPLNLTLLAGATAFILDMLILKDRPITHWLEAHLPHDYHITRSTLTISQLAIATGGLFWALAFILSCIRWLLPARVKAHFGKTDADQYLAWANLVAFVSPVAVFGALIWDLGWLADALAIGGVLLAIYAGLTLEKRFVRWRVWAKRGLWIGPIAGAGAFTIYDALDRKFSAPDIVWDDWESIGIILGLVWAVTGMGNVISRTQAGVLAGAEGIVREVWTAIICGVVLSLFHTSWLPFPPMPRGGFWYGVGYVLYGGTVGPVLGLIYVLIIRNWLNHVKRYARMKTGERRIANDKTFGDTGFMTSDIAHNLLSGKARDAHDASTLEFPD